MEHCLEGMKKKDFYKATTPFLFCKDYLVSKKVFTLKINTQLEMLVTTPVPVDIKSYYNSKTYQSYKKGNQSLLDVFYNIVKKKSFKRKKGLIGNKLSKKTLLDIGAGTGDFLLYCKKFCHQVYGAEPNECARKKAELNQVKLAKDIACFKGKRFEIITMWHVLEHVSNLEECLEQLKLLLSKRGQLFIAVPNFKSFDANHYKEFWAAFDVPRHLWHFSQKSIHSLFQTVDMKVTKIYPMKFDSFYVSLLSEKHKTGRYNYLKAFLIGLISNIKAGKTKEYSSLIYVLEHS